MTKTRIFKLVGLCSHVFLRICFLMTAEDKTTAVFHLCDGDTNVPEVAPSDREQQSLNIS